MTKQFTYDDIHVAQGELKINTNKLRVGDRVYLINNLGKEAVTLMIFDTLEGKFILDVMYLYASQNIEQNFNDIVEISDRNLKYNILIDFSYAATDTYGNHKDFKNLIRLYEQITNDTVGKSEEESWLITAINRCIALPDIVIGKIKQSILKSYYLDILQAYEKYSELPVPSSLKDLKQKSWLRG